MSTPQPEREPSEAYTGLDLRIDEFINRLMPAIPIGTSIDQFRLLNNTLVALLRERFEMQDKQLAQRSAEAYEEAAKLAETNWHCHVTNRTEQLTQIRPCHDTIAAAIRARAKEKR